MKTFLLISLFAVLLISGCNGMNAVIDPRIVDRLGGAWSGALDYTPSGGVVTPMTLQFEPLSHYYMKGQMTIGSTIYADNFLDQVDDTILINFPVPTASWELILEGKLTTPTKFEGDVIRREAGTDDVALGTFSATHA